MVEDTSLRIALNLPEGKGDGKTNVNADARRDTTLSIRGDEVFRLAR
jgi:hypothetical protein